MKTLLPASLKVQLLDWLSQLFLLNRDRTASSCASVVASCCAGTYCDHFRATPSWCSFATKAKALSYGFLCSNSTASVGSPIETAHVAD